MVKQPTKYIFVLGGVLSGLGKGIASASIGYLLKSRGFSVTIMKLDPYLNVDPGTMNPFQHGEVFVLDDGSETDLDLGHYERFTGIEMSAANNTTTGQIYQAVLDRERRGDYLGQTIQVIPHITDEIKRVIKAINTPKKFEVIICEVGGTVGDIESLPFLETIRQMRMELGKENCFIAQVTLVPFIKTSGELKTKPTQHSVMKLREIGLNPDLLLCRTAYPIPRSVRDKIALFCNVHPNHVIEAIDVESIYEVPLVFYNQGVTGIIINQFLLDDTDHDISKLENFVYRVKNPSQRVTISLCGKYTSLPDSYKSVIEAFTHAGVENDAHVILDWVDTEDIQSQEDVVQHLSKADGILILPGFGSRGIEGKIKCAQFARENRVPCLGICLGLQCAVIEFARNVCGLKKANSTEFKKQTPDPVISLMSDQKKVKSKGGTMRLGAYPCKLKPGTRAYAAYRKKMILERHRHRYEVNNKYKKLFGNHGIIFSGINPELNLVEIVELKDHPWFVASQFHPELKSRVEKAHPLFREFVKASIKYRKTK